MSMGLGPMNAIYQARFNRYLHDRGIKDTSDQHVWAFLGDGEMDEPESRGLVARRRHRGPGQPDLRRQLQPAAPRRPGPRQRQDHPGAGVVLPRRRLERHQGRLGPRVGRAAARRPRRRAGQPDEHHPGRRLPDLPGQRRRVRPRALLRPRPAHQGAGQEPSDQRDLEPQARRPRLPQGLRRLQGGDGAQGPADGDPGQDHQGLRPGPALRGPQRHPPDEEADPRGPEGFPGPAAHPDLRRRAREGPVPAAVLPPGPGRPGDPVPARAAPALGGFVPRAAHHAQPLVLPGDKAYDVVRKGLRQAGGRHHHGVRPAVKDCCGTRRSASGSCRSSRTRPARSAWTRSSRR